MLEAEQKAKELVDKFSTVGLQQRDEGIECALICVNEIIKTTPLEKDYEEHDRGREVWYYDKTEFWQEVKANIEKQ